MILTWQCNDWRQIPLQAMEKSHIHNCIAILMRGGIRRPGCNGFTNREWILIFKTELLRRSKLQSSP